MAEPGAAEKARENRVRRMAERQGLRVEKSKRRDPNALDFGRWWVYDARSDALLYGGQTGGDLDFIEAELEKGWWRDA